jgi:DNA polymerase III subunit delta
MLAIERRARSGSGGQAYIGAMSLVAERALRTAIREKRFERAYCFYGDDDFQKSHAVRELTDAATDQGTRDFNCDVLRGSEIPGETLDTLLATPPMMAPRRVIVIREAHSLTKAARAALDRYLERPAPDTVLVLVVPAGEKPDPAWLDRAHAIEFPPLAAERIPRWIVHYAMTALGTEITSGAAALLQRAAGTDMGQLAGELDKLASYGAGQVITEEAVSAVVGVRRGESLGDLLDAVAERNAARAGDLAAPVLAQPKMSLVSAIMALTAQMIAVGWGLSSRGRAGALERDYYTLLKETRVYPGRSWGEAVPAWARAARTWTPQAVDEALDLLLAADRAAKETRHSSDEQLLGWLVLALCATGQRAAA